MTWLPQNVNYIGFDEIWQIKQNIVSSGKVHIKHFVFMWKLPLKNLDFNIKTWYNVGIEKFTEG